jgi:hypothetical protein
MTCGIAEEVHESNVVEDIRWTRGNVDDGLCLPEERVGGGMKRLIFSDQYIHMLYPIIFRGVRCNH